MQVIDPVKYQKEPNLVYYLRQDKDSPTLLGPTSYLFAHDQAKKLSELPEYHGTMQIYVIVGERPGDLPATETNLQVVAYYVNGKMVMGGRQADRHASLGLPYNMSLNVGK